MKQPKITTLLFRGLTRRCPACGSRKIFTNWAKIKHNCPKCNFHFERIEGHWVGAIGINTILTFATLLISLIVGLVITFPEFPTTKLIIINTVVALTSSIFYFPISKTLWTAIDIAMRPIQEEEFQTKSEEL